MNHEEDRPQVRIAAPQLGRIDTEHVAGVHLNDPITIPSWSDDGSGYSASDQEKLA